MKKFTDIVKRTSDIFSWMAGGAIVVAMLLVVANVILRKIFKSPVLGVYEFTGFLSVIIISFGLAYVLVVDAHIAVDFIVEKFKPSVRNVIDSITGILVLSFMSIFTWNSFVYATKVLESNQLSPTTQTPFYIFIYAMAACFVLLCLVYITKVRESLGKLRSE